MTGNNYSPNGEGGGGGRRKLLVIGAVVVVSIGLVSYVVYVRRDALQALKQATRRATMVGLCLSGASLLFPSLTITLPPFQRILSVFGYDPDGADGDPALMPLGEDNNDGEDSNADGGSNQDNGEEEEEEADHSSNSDGEDNNGEIRVEEPELEDSNADGGSNQDNGEEEEADDSSSNSDGDDGASGDGY